MGGVALVYIGLIIVTVLPQLTRRWQMRLRASGLLQWATVTISSSRPQRRAWSQRVRVHSELWNRGRQQG